MSADEIDADAEVPHVLTSALANAIAAHNDLSAAVIAMSDRHSTRTVARLLGVAPMTAHRWRTEIPGTAAIADALETARRQLGHPQ